MSLPRNSVDSSTFPVDKMQLMSHRVDVGRDCSSRTRSTDFVGDQGEEQGEGAVGESAQDLHVGSRCPLHLGRAFDAAAQCLDDAQTALTFPWENEGIRIIRITMIKTNNKRKAGKVLSPSRSASAR